eukprot:CAMPEP_0179194966 /NCGR_PEP_ID=MMETSP0796-20121207/96911_1 /TAXON_ID=73915 /ORGANISM="Pyrodinium bahamense, Strain pbaha01" /LENGTH=1418 /DNA_ID=CAMNT_0020899311 /DNA_START=105 /DNA_END=4361 /DNA_ORIENTATION=+
MTTYAQGTLIWIKHEEEVWMQAEIVTSNEKEIIVKTAEEPDGRIILAPNEPIFLRTTDVFTTEGLSVMDDLTQLDHLHEPAVLSSLQNRFDVDKIYTFTGPILIALNPFKVIPNLYDDDVLKTFITTKPCPKPHVFNTSNMAYRGICDRNRSQTVLISGESGAGKTETTKFVMKFLAVAGSTDGGVTNVEKQVLESNPLLEAFGNARTLRNDNSSRFGKFIELQFRSDTPSAVQVGQAGSHARLCGARIQTYLLEKVRVCDQQEGERNYHVFYEMLVGLDDEMLDRLLLDPCINYRLLYAGSAQPCAQGSPEAQRQAQQFAGLRRALSTFINPDVEQDLWEAVAALIHLGEVEFDDLTAGAEGEAAAGPPARSASPAPLRALNQSPEATESSQAAKVEVAERGRDALAQAADLLGLSQCRLEQVLKWKEMHVKRQNRRTSHINCPRTKAQASQTLQSIIKVLYKRIFDKIVEHINASSAGNTTARGGSPDGNAGGSEVSYNSIGTLDIYGFERLHTNSFEQLCINLANERLQQFFIEEVLEAEQRTYAEERLNICRWQLPDNQPVVKGIQAIMSVLDEHSLRTVKNLVGSGEDKDLRFCEHVHRTQIRGSGPVMALRLRANRNGNGPSLHDGFQIRHYAGDVSYSTRGWIDKNNDALVPEVETLLADGTKQLVRSMSDAKSVDALSGERLHSVSRDYLTNLDNLLATLKTCSVHYIRCFNPNQNRSAGFFDPKYVLDQVIQCGTVELVKIMHHGFPHRCFLQDLRRRFTNLLPEDFNRYSDRDFVWAIMLAFEIDESQWTLGTKRLFLKAGQLRTLENLRDLGSTASTQIIWKIRMQFARKKVRAWSTVICLMAWWPAHVRKQRRLVLITGLRKAIYILVRLHRWLGKVRGRLYGVAPTTSMAHVDLAMLQQGLTFSLPRLPGPELALRACGTGVAQLFIALNSYEEPQYASYLQTGIDVRNLVHDDVLKMWQRSTTESIIFYTGSSVMSARLSPRAFLRQGSSHIPSDGNAPSPTYGRSLEDIRQVDVHDSGRAFPLSERRWDSNITCVCQHRAEKQIFATCDKDNQIVIWKWLGTETHDIEKPAAKPLFCFFYSKLETVFQMTFLSEVPQRIAEKNGMVLIILSAEAGRHWLNLTIVSVYSSMHNIEHIETVGVYSDLLPSLRRTGVQISFFTTSHTDRILVLGGRGLLQFWAIQEGPGGDLSLSLIEDIAQMYSAIKQNSMVSCLCLPPPIRSGGILDWIVIGDCKGKLYGFRFDIRENNRIAVNTDVSGRFRSNRHTEGVPVRKLVATYGATPYVHHKAVQAKGVSYGLFLNRAPLDEKGFYSLGEDGKLLTWKLLETTGWTATDEISFRDLSCAPTSGWQPQPCGASCQFIAAHSSRLVPSIMVIVDQDRKLFMCYDRTKPEELAAEAMAGYA